MMQKKLFIGILLTLSVLSAGSSFADDERFGMNLQPHLEWVYPLVFDGMNRLGATWVRTTVYWNKIEPQPGRYQWGKLDGLVQNASQRNLGLLITLRTAKSRDDASSFPNELKPYSEFIRNLAARYKSKKIAWQIEDKPDLPSSWSSTQEQYIELLKAAYAAAHAGDPQIVIVSAGLACPFPSLNDLDKKLEENRQWFEAILKSKAYDVVDLHNYFPPEKNPSGMTFEEYLVQHEEWMKALGVQVPIWISETGVNSKSVTLDGKKIDFSEMAQAKALYLIYTTAKSHGVAHVFWLKVIDNSSDTGWTTSMGLSRPNQKAKPAGDVYKKLSKGIPIFQ